MVWEEDCRYVNLRGVFDTGNIFIFKWELYKFGGNRNIFYSFRLISIIKCICKE